MGFLLLGAATFSALLGPLLKAWGFLDKDILSSESRFFVRARGDIFRGFFRKGTGDFAYESSRCEDFSYRSFTFLASFWGRIANFLYKLEDMAFFTFVYVDGHGRFLGLVVALYQMMEGSVNEEGYLGPSRRGG
jgi:hypothetical protein